MTEIHDTQYVYVVTEFGCNSSHNDMYPPTVMVYKSKIEAYECYNAIKKTLYSYDPDYPFKVHEYTYPNGESAIQDGDDVKRPQGVSIQYAQILERPKEK
jgi:hypothetical protein